MADDKNTVSDLADLKDIAGGAPAADAPADAADAGETVVPAAPPAPLREQELDAQGRAYATGRRKDAVARVWIKPGSGKVTVNGRDQEVYFARPTLRLVINQPFSISEREGQYDVVATVTGGGLSGQAGAVKHGISQALTKFEPALRSTVKAAGFLTRDSRVVERKKYGRAKARKRPAVKAAAPWADDVTGLSLAVGPAGVHALPDEIAMLSMTGFPNNAKRAARLCVVALAEEIGVEPSVDLSSQIDRVTEALERLASALTDAAHDPRHAAMEWQRTARKATLQAFFCDRF